MTTTPSDGEIIALVGSTTAFPAQARPKPKIVANTLRI